MADNVPRKIARHTLILAWSAVLTLAIAAAALPLMIGFAVAMPGASYDGLLLPLKGGDLALRARLELHIATLAGEIGERNLQRRPAELSRAADYIRQQLLGAGPVVSEHDFAVAGKRARNIVAERRGASKPGEIIVIGAHYDTHEGTAGADDNGSGVAALIEIAGLFPSRAPSRTVRFVAFANEEPPYFRSMQMGSRQYARRCRERSEDVRAMISLDAIGYYSDQEDSQHYPAPLSIFYPSRGNFLAFVGNWSSRHLVRKSVHLFRAQRLLASEGAVLPASLPGVDWSDHASFWEEGYRALMVTDTATFRNPHYHEPTDAAETIDYDRLTRATIGLSRIAYALAEETGDSVPSDDARMFEASR